MLKVTNIIVPNETESAAITGINVTDEESMQRTARYFREKGVKVTIITLGSRGVYNSSPTENRFISAYKVNAVDTTGAGDTFIGAMTSVLTTDLLNISAAIDYGSTSFINYSTRNRSSTVYSNKRKNKTGIQNE